MISFQTSAQGGQASPQLLRRVFAHHLFTKTSPQQIKVATGKSHHLDLLLIRFTHMLAPWFLVASLVLLVPTIHWLTLIFAPLFLLGYFMFAFQSVKEGGIALPTVIAILATALLFVPGTNPYTSGLLATLGLSLWCNRFSWWYADVSLARNPALGQLFRNQQAGASTGASSSDAQVVDAEVIEVSDS